MKSIMTPENERLDRFLLLEDCQKIGRVIPVDEEWQNPFRFENMWLKVNGFRDLLRSWWLTVEARGQLGSCIIKGVIGRASCRQKSGELWLREESRNTKFSHKMVNAYRRRNLLAKNRVNISWLAEEEKTKEGLENLGWVDDEALEVPFSEELEAMVFFKEFYAFESFERSLNATFLILILMKGGTEDLKIFRSMSLMSSLYKLLTKVLANRLRMWWG
ncbi:hypothetical protein CK203_011423 [Vitis vinifera]|uniref:Reverse transcriptase zinc-binding domain-containing protein n=1 Tax=Vitis vinifera TaxID=29760 RepID=A0A438JYS0_VITVI|nr:hypothetical protein CK203_011423 [Vitis vinifera]